MTLLWIALILFLAWFAFQAVWGLRMFPRVIEGIRTGAIARSQVYISQMAGLWAPSAAVIGLAAFGEFTWKDVGLAWFRPGKAWLVVTAAVLAALYLAYLLYSLITLRRGGQGVPATERVPERLQPLFPVTPAEKRLWACTALSAGFTEELLFRGFLLYALGALLPGLPVWAALLIATALFGLGHLYQGPSEAVQPMAIGLLYGVFYIAFGTLLPCIVLHAAQDMLVLFAADGTAEIKTKT